MRFVMTPVGSSGDVHPFVGIGRTLKARGHDVVIATSATFEGVVHEAGLQFYPTASAEDFDAVSRNADIWHPRRGLRLVLGEVTARLQVAYDGLRELYEPGRTVLVGHALSLSTRVFEETHAVPASTMHLAPSLFRSRYVLPHCAAIVHHGGVGTLAQGLAAGVPQLVMPMGFDQPDNATRSSALGVGPTHSEISCGTRPPQRPVAAGRAPFSRATPSTVRATSSSNSARSGRALSVHDLRRERLRFGQVDVVLLSRLFRGELRQVLERLGGHGRGHAAEERAQLFLALTLFAIQIQEAVHRIGQPMHGDLRDDLAEVGHAVVGATAANEHEILGQGTTRQLADTALKSDRGDVVLTAPVRTPADLDVTVCHEVHEFRVRAEMLGQLPSEPP
jgi:hypothetical protein